MKPKSLNDLYSELEYWRRLKGAIHPSKRPDIDEEIQKLRLQIERESRRIDPWQDLKISN